MQLKTPSTFFAVILAACLMVLGAVSPALAATPSQADDGVLQVWASNVYPAADAPGMISFVALYPNNAAEVVTIYLGKGDVTETGTWETGDDGAVLVTLTGNADREYNEPTTMTLTPEADMMSDGVFTYQALTVVTPAEMDALIEGAEDETAASDAENSDTAEMDSASDMRRIWVSNVYPAADASGLITMLALYDNGNMDQYSIYLGKGVVNEIGIWEEDAGDAISVTATGTPDEEYTEANTTTYQHVDDTLIDGVFVLTLWPEVSPEEMANAVDPSGVYGSNVYPAADAAGYVMVLALYDNNNAEQTTIYLTKGASSEVGTWAKRSTVRSRSR
ncbi:MAG: copper resistance protein NlpE N-terminal domain-containing protein [Anaerolineales bacterium]|nr:copper resistance protein NlpE N-terminal domain-containing protein [Anaerolineales bacterium]